MVYSILNKVRNGIYPNSDDIQFINGCAMEILSKNALLPTELDVLSCILDISNILYNNTDRTVLPLEDGIYDMLVVKYSQYRKYEVRALPVTFEDVNQSKEEDEHLEYPYACIDEDYIEDSIFIKNELSRIPPSNHNVYQSFRVLDDNRTIKKANVNVPHKYPKLVGTLDKCKFVLLSQAIEKGVVYEPNVKIFERDFLDKHVQMGLIDPNGPIDLIMELKYDGISVEADVTDKILSARTRGDTDADVAADLTPLFGGFKFLNCPEIGENESFGMKFEAIITKDNLRKLCELRGISYVNCRVAIIGLAGASDAYKYRNFITLIPLETSLNIDRETEMEFMNRYYNMGEYNRYSIVHARNYTEALFMVHKFVEESERIRAIMPYMYDGVVVSYLDPKLRQILGREGAVNKYSMAIKFNPLKKQTKFLRYSYTIGMNGVVTPMLHYNPVEFFGSIHTKSSGHSYARFKELNLKKGDIIDLEYTNDVMPYATRANCEENDLNMNPYEEFPTICPSCGAPLEFASDKTVLCKNFHCPERVYNRAGNMMKVLGIKDFSAERMKELNVKSLSDLAAMNPDFISSKLGPNNGAKLYERVNNILYSNTTWDYTLMASLGFTNISTTTWKKILRDVNFNLILNSCCIGGFSNDNTLKSALTSVRHIGEATAETIINEGKIFKNDISFISYLMSEGFVLCSYGSGEARYKVRFTGCRDPQLVEYFTSMGFDADAKGSVTKDTSLLIVPYDGFVSTKTSKIDSNKCIIASINKVKENPRMFYDAICLNNAF